jgi:hypothetical protein
MPLLYGYTRNLRSWHHEIEETCPYLSATDKVDVRTCYCRTLSRDGQALPKQPHRRSYYIRRQIGRDRANDLQKRMDGVRPFSPSTHVVFIGRNLESLACFLDASEATRADRLAWRRYQKKGGLNTDKLFSKPRRSLLQQGGMSWPLL